ncbi:hypothetical protein T492DRAFT_878240 [Pavlovales sp. CCMP2436]|nr:hypothetical protein T492DRAFT_878240 [Pavlovales sp. CCMP2436]
MLFQQSPPALNVLSPLTSKTDMLAEQSTLAADILSLSALQTIPLPPGEPPPCPIEGVCPGFGLDNPLTPCQLLLASAPLAAAVLQAISPQSSSLPVHSSLLLFMQATLSASARPDALAASSPLHFRQATPSASAHSDALAASSTCTRLLQPRRAQTC